MIFCANKDSIFKLNLEPKVKQFEAVAALELSLLRKITVIKTFALPKIIYTLSSLPNPPRTVINYIEKQKYSFLRNGKPEKVKRSSLIQTYDTGGLK